MPEKYKGVQIMMDYEAESVVTLGELTPAWCLFFAHPVFRETIMM